MLRNKKKLKKKIKRLKIIKGIGLGVAVGGVIGTALPLSPLLGTAAITGSWVGMGTALASEIKSGKLERLARLKKSRKRKK